MVTWKVSRTILSCSIDDIIVFGRPLETVFSVAPIRFARDNLPGMKAILAPPVAVENLAKVGVAAAIGDISNRPGGVFTIDDIQTVSR